MPQVYQRSVLGGAPVTRLCRCSWVAQRFSAAIARRISVLALQFAEKLAFPIGVSL